MLIKEIIAKNIITKSNLPESDYVINPYIGCSHSCIYCYARFMKRFSGHNEKWGKFVDVKMNAISLIPDKTTRYVGKSIYLSSVTDPYIPIEKKYELTRGILEKLANLQPYLGIQTKSNLIIRDIDLLKKYNSCEAGLTITTLDDNLRKLIEPFTSSIQNRIEALKKLKEAGIKTYVFIGPIMPLLTNWKSIVNETRNYADCFMFENLNLYGTIKSDVNEMLSLNYPYLIDEYAYIYSKESNYWHIEEKAIIDYCNSKNIKHKIFFHHKAKDK